jgi:iron complex transport system ATP-binding protein
MAELVSARALVIGRQGRALTDAFDLDLSAGEILAVLGPNGAGKSTLIGTLLGVVPALSGSVLWSGIPVGELSKRQRSLRVAWVPQHDSIAFDLSLPDYVMLGRLGRLGFGQAPGVQDRDQVDEAIDRVGLSAFRERRLGQMSGGERRLAAIARGLAQQAGAILLDEPLAGLDLSNQCRLLDGLGRLAADGIGLAYTTQDPNHPAMAASRALLIRPGGKVLAGSLEAVLTPAHLTETFRIPVETVVSTDGRTWLVPTVRAGD